MPHPKGNQKSQPAPEPAEAEPADAAEPAEAEPAATEPAEAALPEPLNRAERRARRRGKKPPLPSDGQPPPTGRRDPVVMPRRSGRRGNR